MADPYVAEIRIFPYMFGAPTGWALCNGQLLPLSQNTALFSLLGSMYGGDGKSTFALPNLQGRVPLHAGQGLGLSERELATEGGTEFLSLTETEIPAHAHTLFANAGFGSANDPGGRVFARPFGGGFLYRATGPNTPMAAEMLSPTGGGQPHNNLQPYLALNFCIALQGEFPPRT